MSLEPCSNCGAPMADDQRYCLECGTRRGDARIDYRPLLGATAPGAGAAAPGGGPAPPASAFGRPSWTLTAALATIACLLLALGIGVLIGRAGQDDKVQAAAPAQVIRVSGGGGDGSTTTASDTSSTTDAAATKKSSKTDKKAAAKAAKTAAKTSGAVKALDKTSGADYQKQSAKLPKQVGTGGKAPAKDNKPAAGGGGFEDIG